MPLCLPSKNRAVDFTGEFPALSRVDISRSIVIIRPVRRICVQTDVNRLRGMARKKYRQSPHLCDVNMDHRCGHTLVCLNRRDAGSGGCRQMDVPKRRRKPLALDPRSRRRDGRQIGRDVDRHACFLPLRIAINELGRVRTN